MKAPINATINISREAIIIGTLLPNLSAISPENNDPKKYPT